MTVPSWLLKWGRGSTGISACTIAATLLADGQDYALGLLGCWSGNAPHDASDTARCIRFLDLAEANGVHLRSRMGGMVKHHQWERMAPHWSVIEASILIDREEDAVETHRITTRKDGKPRKRQLKRASLGPSRAYVLINHLRSDNYAGRDDILKSLRSEAASRYDVNALLTLVGLDFTA